MQVVRWPEKLTLSPDVLVEYISLRGGGGCDHRCQLAGGCHRDEPSRAPGDLGEAVTQPLCYLAPNEDAASRDLPITDAWHFFLGTISEEPVNWARTGPQQPPRRWLVSNPAAAT